MKTFSTAFALLLFSCPFFHEAAAGDDDRPNIIVFMADDMGFEDTGFTGSPDIKTPNLDALAAGGMICTSGYVAPAPSNDAAEFVKREQQSPFFLFVSYNAPHAPQQAPKEDIARYSHIENKKRRT